jgi:ribosomal-protein-alanine N-acetyltransferase
LLDKIDGSLVGGCGVGYFHELRDAELSYTLAKRYWGQGLATEAAVRVLRYAFEVLQLPRVVAVAQVANVASQKVMLKAGMTFQRTYHDEGKEAVLYAIENPHGGLPAGQGV